MHEDSQAMIRVVETGRNPTMRYLGRTQSVSIAWLHETFKGDDLSLAYEISTRMCANIYAKACVDAENLKHACYLIGVCDPKELDELARRSREWEIPLPQSGGKKAPSTTGCNDGICAISGKADASVVPAASDVGPELAVQGGVLFEKIKNVKNINKL